MKKPFQYLNQITIAAPEDTPATVTLVESIFNFAKNELISRR
jgi:hypothetical protein